MSEDEKYRPLKDYVRKRGGPRLAFHGRLRDQLVEMAVEDFPVSADDETGPEVLAARLRLRAREKYGSVMLLILVSIFSNLVARYVWEWWKRRHPHQVLMRGWQESAKKGR
jgi:hypothetical protein